jgi:maltose alpha-D-glucosyltransferase/alpha-amylase
MADITVPEGAEMIWISAEQSNSSVIVGDVAIIKMFRRLTDGPHPEAEMGRYLTENGFANTPALLGEVVRVEPDGTRHALAIAQAFVRNQGDAWGWTLELLLRGLSDITGGDESAAEDAANHSDYVRFAALLGQRIAEMHLVLAQPSSNSDFVPVSGTSETVADFTERVLGQLEAAYRTLDTDEAAEHPDRPAMLRARQALFTRLPILAKAAQGATLTRIHGDMHLGQVLVCNGDVMIIDFEGEPAKPVDVRRSKDHRLRDVAGMIRSFDYAAAVVKRRSQASHAHLADDQVSAFLDSFVQRATESFLAGYREATASANEQANAGAEAQLLDLFLIEKAAYEVAYEASNRPTWIDVPMRGLARYTLHLLGVEAVA